MTCGTSSPHWGWDRHLRWAFPAQQPDGSWRPDGGAQSPAYATSMTILALTVPCRMLPIYQRDETVDMDSEKEEK